MLAQEGWASDLPKTEEATAKLTMKSNADKMKDELIQKLKTKEAIRERKEVSVQGPDCQSFWTDKGTKLFYTSVHSGEMRPPTKAIVRFDIHDQSPV
jgi:hypothetical protein